MGETVHDKCGVQRPDVANHRGECAYVPRFAPQKYRHHYGQSETDPLATPQKRATEELKYAESKRTYGFCITGFQVYCLSSGQLEKFGKHYGKTLDAKGVVEGIL